MRTIPVPPASNFAGSGGGDGWAVALSETAVYNVFHHQSSIQVACHLQVNAETCPGWPKTITEGANQFSSQPQPGLYLDQHTGRLYVFATRLNDLTGGVVCVDTTSSEPDPFCGFTTVTGAGEAPLTTNRSISGLSNPMLIGKHLYAFNNSEAGRNGDQNKLTCFDVGTTQPCTGQPYTVAMPPGSAGVSTLGNEPVGETAAIADKVIVPMIVEGVSWLACFDDATQQSCSGQWPLKLSFSYGSTNGAPFPLLTSNGTAVGLCLPTGVDQCFNLQGEAVATPAGMTEAIPATEEWNGPAVILGPRVYLPNGNTDEVDCFDYATGKGCANFPKKFSNLGLLYTVNSDPQRPTCLWVNSDFGSAQIQAFDAYTGEACGEGSIRVLASQFVVPKPECTPASYVSMQLLTPPRSSYANGTIAFADGDGNPIGLEERALDGAGAASLVGLDLNTPTGLPQFLFTLNGVSGQVGNLEVQLTWLADYNVNCIGEHTTVVAPASTPAQPASQPAAKPVAAVLPTATAHLAGSRRACVASSSYLASVSGKHIQSVTYTLNGHKLKTLRKPNSHGSYALRVPVKAGKVGHLTIHVSFTSAARNRSQTIHKTLARCAVRHRAAKPRFTG